PQLDIERRRGASGYTWEKTENETIRTDDTALPCTTPRPAFLFLLASDGLCRTLAGTGIGMGTLSAHRQTTTVTQATVVAQIHQTLDVHGNRAAKITLDLIVTVDGFANLDNFRVRQLIHAPLGRNGNLLANFRGHLRPNPVNILQRDNHALVRRDVDASNTSHAGSPKLV